MLNKLALRNVKRSMRDYLVYLITMIAVAAMMFAFNSLIFSKDILRIAMNARLHITGKVQVNIRLFVSIKAKECFERNLVTIHNALGTAVRAVFIWKVKAIRHRTIRVKITPLALGA